VSLVNIKWWLVFKTFLNNIKLKNATKLKWSKCHEYFSKKIPWNLVVFLEKGILWQNIIYLFIYFKFWQFFSQNNVDVYARICLIFTYFVTFLITNKTYSLQYRLSRWNPISTSWDVIHNWVIMSFQCMMH